MKKLMKGLMEKVGSYLAMQLIARGDYHATSGFVGRLATWARSHSPDVKPPLPVSYRGKVWRYDFEGVGHIELCGGPYPAKEAGYPGVCLLPKIPEGMDASYHFPIEDFKAPSVEQARARIPVIVDLLVAKRALYVGCTAGIGRTGTVIALIMKEFDKRRGLVRSGEDYIDAVREFYYSGAIETLAQEKLVKDY